MEEEKTGEAASNAPQDFLKEKAHTLSSKDIIRLSFRIFRTKPLRTFLTVLGMSLGVGIVLVLTSLGYGMQYLLIGKLVTTEDSLTTLDTYYAPDSQAKILKADVEKTRAIPGIKEISSYVELPAEVTLKDQVGSSTPSAYLLARIIDGDYYRLSGVVPDIVSDSKEDSKSVTLSAAALKILNLPIDKTSLGKTIGVKIFYPLSPSDSNSAQEIRVEEAKNTLTVHGIMADEAQPPVIIISSGEIPDEPPYYDHMLVHAQTADSLEAIRNKLIDFGFLVSSRVDLVNQIKKITNIVTIVLGVFGITALVVSAIGMFNTMVISFLERVFEVGIMKAIGATDRDIRNLFLMESLIMGVLGGVGGIILGILLSNGINLGLNLLARSLGGKPVNLFVRPWWFMVLIVVFSGVIGIFSGFWPARRAVKVSPKEAFLRK